MSERQFTWRTPVIAIDFDGCLCTDEYPEIGKPIWEIINQAKRLREKGACLILWTCRSGKDLEAAVEACRGWGLEFDEVNANPQFRIDLYGGNDCRKVGADEYWDDRSVFMGGPAGVWRNIRGASVALRSRDHIRKFMDEALRPELDYLHGLDMTANGKESQNFYGGLYNLLSEALEEMEFMFALLDERNDAHEWYKDGYADATQNAASWVTNMIEYMKTEEPKKAGDPECE